MRFLQIVSSKDELPDERLSASQIGTYLRCPAKWGYEKILKLPRKTTASQSLGTKVHAHLEDYLAQGKLIPNDKPGQLAQVATRDLPLPRTVEPESEFFATLDTPNGQAGYVGYIDFWHPNLGALDANQLGPVLSPYAREGTGLTGDHKTSKDPELYAKSHDELTLDPQRILYTAVGVERALARGADPDRWVCYWNYIATTGFKRTLPVITVQDVTDGSLDEYFAEIIVKPSSEMVLARKEQTPPADLKQNPAACDDYGGCEHRAICPVVRSQVQMPTLAEMKAAKLGTPAPEPTQTEPTSEPAPVKAEVPLAERLKGLTPAPAKGKINPPDAADTPAEPAPEAPKAKASAAEGKDQAKAKPGPKPKASAPAAPAAPAAPVTGDLRALVMNAIDTARASEDFHSMRLLCQVMEGLKNV